MYHCYRVACTYEIDFSINFLCVYPCQVNELDVALHSHQADTTSRRLQLERALTQRQADLRARTQEVLTQYYNTLGNFQKVKFSILK